MGGVGFQFVFAASFDSVRKENLYGNQSETVRGLFILQKIRGDNNNMKEILMQTYTIVLPILMGYMVWLLKNQKKDRDSNGRGTMLLLRVQLIEYHDKYMALGYIPSYAYENFVEMYEAYHELGGNGMITKMYKEIQELHLATKKGE